MKVRDIIRGAAQMGGLSVVALLTSGRSRDVAHAAQLEGAQP